MAAVLLPPSERRALDWADARAVYRYFLHPSIKCHFRMRKKIYGQSEVFQATRTPGPVAPLDNLFVELTYQGRKTKGFVTDLSEAKQLPLHRQVVWQAIHHTYKAWGEHWVDTYEEAWRKADPRLDAIYHVIETECDLRLTVHCVRGVTTDPLLETRLFGTPSYMFALLMQGHVRVPIFPFYVAPGDTDAEIRTNLRQGVNSHVESQALQLSMKEQQEAHQQQWEQAEKDRLAYRNRARRAAVAAARAVPTPADPLEGLF